MDYEEIEQSDSLELLDTVKSIVEELERRFDKYENLNSKLIEQCKKESNFFEDYDPIEFHSIDDLKPEGVRFCAVIIDRGGLQLRTVLYQGGCFWDSDGDSLCAPVKGVLRWAYLD